MLSDVKIKWSQEVPLIEKYYTAFHESVLTTVILLL